LNTDEFQNGPLCLRIEAQGGGDYSWIEWQLFNKDGFAWNQGMPSEKPKAITDRSDAASWNRIYADEFNALPEIRSWSMGTGYQNSTQLNDPNVTKRYTVHKPGGGDTSTKLWIVDVDNISGKDDSTLKGGPRDPYSNAGGKYLRIRANDEQLSTGQISSYGEDKRGFAVMAPAYFECSMMAGNVPKTWMAFWLLNTNTAYPGSGQKGHSSDNPADPCDELDIIETYGSSRRGTDSSSWWSYQYQITSHAWGWNPGPGQYYTPYTPAPDGTFPTGLDWGTGVANNGGGKGGSDKAGVYTMKNMLDPQNMVGSGWSWGFHKYGCLVDLDYTYYYCDDVLMAWHKTTPLSKTVTLHFLISHSMGGNNNPSSANYVDLSRHDGISDMFIDWVRVYKK